MTVTRIIRNKYVNDHSQHKDLRLNVINLLNTNLEIRYTVKVLFNYEYAFKNSREIKALS